MIRKSHPIRFMFVVIMLGNFMSAVDLTIVATALPTIRRSLHSTINWAGWTITIYGLFTVVSLPIAGKLSNQLGRRRVFLVGIALFTASSLLCGFATNVYVLIAFRALQATGGATFAPSAAGIIADQFGPRREQAIGLFGTVGAAGQIFGPVFGGLLVGFLSWRWIFFVNVPIGIVLFFFVARIVPASQRTESSKIDLRGLALTAGVVLTLILGITDLGNKGTSVINPTFLVPEVIAVALLLLFIRHTKRADSPFIPMKLLRAKGFAIMNMLNFLQGTVTFGVAALVPLYAEQRYGFSSLSAGTLLMYRAFFAALTGVLAAFALRRTGYRLPMAIGFFMTSLSWIWLSLAPRFDLGTYTWLALALSLTGLGLGIVNPAGSNASLHLAPDQVAAVTGLRSMFLNLGVIVSVAITTAILNRSTTPGMTQSHVYWFMAGIIIFVMLPLVSRVPEHEGSW